MPTATITSKGQITIPIDVRERMQLKAGDKIDFYETEAGEFAFVAKTASIRDLEGCIPKLGYIPTLEQMEQGILDAASQDYQATSGIPIMAEDSALERETA